MGTPLPAVRAGHPDFLDSPWDRRNQMLDAFAGLLVEVRLLGCHRGDCSLSNVLCRDDAGAVDMTMVDAETARLHRLLSDGPRADDIPVTVENAGGGRADLAAEQGIDLDPADLLLGEAFARRVAAGRPGHLLG